MPTVRMPDGQLVEMPDQPTPQQLEALSQLNAPRSVGEVVSEHKADIPRGLWKAANATAGTFAGYLASRLAGPDALHQVADPAIAALDKGTSERFMPTPQDRTTADKYARIGLEGVGGSLISPGAKAAPVTTLATGMTAPMGGEAMAQAAGDNPLTRLTGAVLAGGATGSATGLGQRLRPQTADLVQIALRGIDPKALEKAQMFQKLAAARGATIDIAQALEAVGTPSADLTTLRNVLAQSAGGPKTQKMLSNQPGELQNVTTEFTSQMPGTNYGDEAAANILGEATTKTVEGAKRDATNLWGKTAQGTIDAAKQQKIPSVLAAVSALTSTKAARVKAESDLQNLVDQVKMAREGAPPYIANAPMPGADAARAKVTNAAQAEALATQGLAAAHGELKAVTQVPAKVVLEQRAKLLAAAKDKENTPLGEHLVNLANDLLNAKGEPIVDATNLNGILKAAVAKTKTINLKTPGTDRGVTNAMDAAVIGAREDLGAGFEPIRKANEAFKQYYEAVVDPIKQGRVGATARTGYDPASQVPLARLVTMFNGVDPSAAISPIKVAGKQMQKAGEAGAFQDAAKAYWSSKLMEVFEANPAGGPATNLDAAQKIKTFLLAPRTYRAARDTVTTVAEQVGLDPAAAERGLNNYAMLVKGMANTPRKIGGLRDEEVFRMGGQNYGSDALRIFGFLPFNTAARRLEDRVLQNTFRDLDNLMTTPEGVERLIAIGKAPVMSRKAILLFAGITGELGARDSTQAQPQQ